MIVKTFVGRSKEELKERIFFLYGPEAIILATHQGAEGEVEINFGIEEEEFLHYRERSASPFSEEKSWASEELFWEAATLPGL